MTLRIGQPSIFEKLKQQVENIGMRLFDFVKEHDRIRPSADALGKLPSVVVADISGRRSNQFGNCLLFHIFGHIQPDHRIDRAEQNDGESAAKLGFSYSRRTQKEE